MPFGSLGQECSIAAPEGKKVKSNGFLRSSQSAVSLLGDCITRPRDFPLIPWSDASSSPLTVSL